MTTKVVAYRYTASRSFGKRNPKWHYQESFPHVENRKVEDIGRLEKLIRLSDYEALQAEGESLRKDAERYRWLRDGNKEENSEAIIIAIHHYGDEWDEMIDAAMQEDNHDNQ